MRSMSPGYRIIAVDDDKEHLNMLVLNLAYALIPCVPLYYEPDKLCLPEEGFPEARLILMDVNLGGQGHSSEATSMVGTIAMILKSIKPIGPCTLILWSALDSNLVRKIGDLLQDRERYPDLPIFLNYEFVPKISFLSESDTAKINGLAEKVQLFFEGDNLNYALMLWENLLFRTAVKTTGSLVDLARNSASPQSRSNVRSNLSATLQMLAKCAGEAMHSYPEYTHAELGLLPIFTDFLTHSDAFCQERKKAWNYTLSTNGQSEIIPLLSSQLNSWINLSFDVDVPGNTRGGFFLLSSLSSDECQKIIGTCLRCFIRNYFLKSSDNFSKEKMERLLNTSMFGLIEISPSCDYAQNKTRFLRYLFGIFFPVDLVYNILVSGTATNSKTKLEAIKQNLHTIQQIDGVYCLNNFVKNKCDSPFYSFFVNMNYIFSLSCATASEIFKGKQAFRLRESITNDIARKFAEHATRLGIMTVDKS